MKEYKYGYRNLARIVIETQTPLAVGSGENDVNIGKVVARDANGLPYIPGTAIAGVLSHAIGKTVAEAFFGYSKKEHDESKTHGSEIIFSSAQIVDAEGKAVEGLVDIDGLNGKVEKEKENKDFLKKFDILPIRQHVCIGEKGVAIKRGKFDEEIAYKGTRFVFEVELLSETDNADNFNKVLAALANDTLRIGGGTRKGFGKISIVELKTKSLNFSKSDDLKTYIDKTSSLNDSFWTSVLPQESKATTSPNWTVYELKLKPDNFFLFGSGHGDKEADMTQVYENYIQWNNNRPDWKEKVILIPATSVKGAVSHRTTFYYNKIKGIFADDLSKDRNANLSAIEKVEAVKDLENKKCDVAKLALTKLFGSSKDNKDDHEGSRRGAVLVSDVFLEKTTEQTKLLNHVSIDRFTGGALDGALFSEKVIYGNGVEYTLSFQVDKSAFENGTDENATDGDNIQKAFENALRDISFGLLPLGGGVNRGHGCFLGKVFKDGTELTGLTRQ